MSITAFPMDSQVTEMGEDGLPVYDRAFSSSDLREVYKTYFSDGYFAADGTSMNVKPGDGLNVTVQPGKVNIRGTLGFMSEDATVRLDTPDTTNPRIDTIVARLDLSLDKRTIELASVHGTAAASPVAPELTRTDTIWELGLANVTLQANATEVSATDIEDTRLDTDRCGVVNPFAKVDTTSLFEQITAIVSKADEETDASIARLNAEVSETIAQAKSDTDAAIAEDKASLDANVKELDEATNAAVSAMNDALSSTVLSSVWRLHSTSDADYLAYGDDLNGISAPCSKFSDSSSVTGGISNKPSSVTGPFALYTFATEADPSRLGQVLLTCDSDGVKEWARSGAGSSWSDWGAVGGASGTFKALGGTLPTDSGDFNDYTTAGTFYGADVTAMTNAPVVGGTDYTQGLSGGYVLDVTKADNQPLAIIQQLTSLNRDTGTLGTTICARRVTVDGGSSWRNWEFLPVSTSVYASKRLGDSQLYALRPAILPSVANMICGGIRVDVSGQVTTDEPLSISGIVASAYRFASAHAYVQMMISGKTMSVEMALIGSRTNDATATTFHLVGFEPFGGSNVTFGATLRVTSDTMSINGVGATYGTTTISSTSVSDVTLSEISLFAKSQRFI